MLVTFDKWNILLLHSKILLGNALANFYPRIANLDSFSRNDSWQFLLIGTVNKNKSFLSLWRKYIKINI